jgi:hypothetical protein
MLEGYDDDDISIEYRVIVRDIDILRRENVKGLGSLVPDRVRWAKVDGYWAAMTIYEKARSGVTEAEWLIYHFHRQGIAGLDRLLSKGDAFDFLRRSGRKNFAPALFDMALSNFSMESLSRPGSMDVKNSEMVEALLYIAASLNSMDAFYFYSIIGEGNGFTTPQNISTGCALVEAASRGHPDALVNLAKLRIKQGCIAEACFYSIQIMPNIMGYNNLTGSCRVKKSQGEALVAFCSQRCEPGELTRVMKLSSEIDAKNSRDMRAALDDFYTRQLLHVGEPLYIYHD